MRTSPCVALESLRRNVASCARQRADGARQRPRQRGRARALSRARPLAFRESRRDGDAPLRNRLRMSARSSGSTTRAVTVKPFETNVTEAGVGMLALRSRPPSAVIRMQAGKAACVERARAAARRRRPACPAADAGVPVDGRAADADAARARRRQALRTGVRVIDIFTPLCAGQRIGIFAGSGVGKSTLLAMLAHARGFDTVVRGAGRRARPRGARISRRHARRKPRQRRSRSSRPATRAP